MADDQWLQVVAEENENQQEQRQLIVTYRRLKPKKNPEFRSTLSSTSRTETRLSCIENVKRVSWNRALSTRGRASIVATTFADYLPQQRGARKKQKPPIPKGKGKAQQPLNFEKERAYFKEVDAFELIEESPSPKKFAWVSGDHNDDVAIPLLCTRLEKWLHAKQRNRLPSSALSSILKTPCSRLEPIPCNGLDSLGKRTNEAACCQSHMALAAIQNALANSDKASLDLLSIDSGDFEDTLSAIRKLSLASHSSSLHTGCKEPFSALLQECGQSAPSTLFDVFQKFCNPRDIIKIGEGTYGEAFIAGGCVCKVVPIDGDMRVNGEVQKRSVELLEEVILSRTLNSLRGRAGQVDNATTTFIETKDLKVCQGSYDPALLKAWEDWDVKHGSENDHPSQFPEKQCYVVFVLEHGGTDLESFVLLDLNEVRSLLVQVTAALAVAEAAYEFEHRDLHWGNILLSRKEATTMQFILDGKTMFIMTYGLSVSIIDFTLSRINTGNAILYLDLSSDQELFEGPKGDKQSETYRKMREIIDDQWEGSFPKTNVLWLQYLVDILLVKKSYNRTDKDARDLRYLKKRLNSYNSAREAVHDPFFSDLFLTHAI